MAGRRDEGATRFPVDPLRVADAAIGVEFATHQGVDPGLAINDQVQGDRLVTVGRLGRAGRDDAIHRPKHVGDRAGAGQIPVGQQQADAIAAGAAGLLGELEQL